MTNPIARVREQNGFSLMELMVASVCTTIVLGGAVALTSQIQNGYRRQMEDAVGEQEARYALEWISRYLRGAGNNPFGAAVSDCPSSATAFEGIIPNPDGDSASDDITLQSDSNPADGLIGGASPDCDQSGEHVTISYDSATRTITFLDNAEATATSRTDAVIDGLEFVYKDSDGDELAFDGESTGDNAYYVEVRITIRTRTINAATGNPDTRILSSEVRVRER